MSTTTIAARASIAAAVLYQVLLVALIFLRPDLDPYWHTISEWAIGPRGWLMQVAFLISGMSYGLLFLAIAPHATGVVGRVGLAVLLTCALALVGVGLFVTDPLDTPPDQMTTRGVIHSICGLVQLGLFPFAALLVNLSLAASTALPLKVRRLLWLTAGAPLLALICFAVHLSMFVLPLGDQAYGPDVPLGWPVRLVLLTYTAWLITLAWQQTEFPRAAWNG